MREREEEVARRVIEELRQEEAIADPNRNATQKVKHMALFFISGALLGTILSYLTDIDNKKTKKLNKNSI
jgi:F0F1-type ATP synthase assembly protein I